jgi:uncharacterized protein (TIGR03118 family)
MRPLASKKFCMAALSAGFGLLAATANATVISPYIQTNLVSDLPIPGTVMDPNLKNPWGVSESATSPLWVSNQAAGNATLYTIGPTGLTASRAGGPLVVPIPTTSSGPQGPTGQVNNSIGGVATTSFVINQTGTPAAAHFIFADLNGGIYAWAAAPNPAQLQPSTVIPGAVYTGLAIGGTTSAPFLYVANGGTNPGIEVFNGSFVNVTNTTFAGKFDDPNLPAGYVPFNVQNIGGNIYVTYAPATMGANRTPQTGATAGQGFVDIYDTSGNLIKRLISDSELAAPWGIALAPSNFGPLSGDLLIGNFAYGTSPITGMVNPAGGEINAYDPNTGAFIETLDSVAAWEGLWALTFGNGGSGGSPDILYFTTGLNSEMDGLLGAVSVVPEPSGLSLLVGGLAFLGLWRCGWHSRPRV